MRSGSDRALGIERRADGADSRESTLLSDRGLSEVVGYVLIFALIISVVGIITVTGFAQFEDTQEVEQHKNAERGFDVLATNLVEVYEGGAPSRATELNIGEAQLQTGEDMTVNVTVYHADGDDRIVHDVTPLELTGIDETDFVYEGGAVFRDASEGGLVLQDPPFVVSEDRVMLPIVHTYTERDQAISGTTVLVRTLSTERSVEVAAQGESVDEIVLRIENSPRQELWLRYFENEDLGDACGETGDAIQCEIDAPDGRVFVTTQTIELRLEQ